MGKKYVGITVGPVSNMIENATNPLSMWFSSYLISDKLARSTCSNLWLEKNELFKGKEFDILYPYYYKEDEEDSDDISYEEEEEYCDEEYYEEDDEPYVSDEESKEEGIVGRYPNRIIFYVDLETDELKTYLDRIFLYRGFLEYYFPRIEGIKDSEMEEFFYNLVYTDYIILDEDEVKSPNIMLEMFPLLDELDLKRATPKHYDDNKNPLKILYNNKLDLNKLIRVENRLSSFIQVCNPKEYIKLELYNGLNDFSPNRKPEEGKYYTLVRAEGDNLYEIIYNFKTDSEIKEYSTKLLQYSNDVSQAIFNFGGFPIYAGNDSLLFLAPIYSDADKKTIFTLCNEINNKFKEMLNNDNISLSFGITIRHSEYSLGEAFKTVSSCLFEHAKDDNYGKNQMYVDIEELNGQSIDIRIKHDNYTKIKDILDGSLTDNELQSLQSIISHLNDNKDKLS